MKAYYIPVGRKRNDHANRNGETTMATATLETEVTEVESPNGLVIDTFRFDATIHNGYITIHNTNTGNHRTFRIETVKGGALDGKRIVSLLIGPDRDDDSAWRGFAFVDEFGIRVWKRFRESGDFVKFARMLETPSKYEAKGCRYLIEGRCRRCNRILTNPSSLTDGYGPICRTK